MKVNQSKKVEKQSWPYDNAKRPILLTFSQKIEFSIIQVLIQSRNLEITAESPNGAPLVQSTYWFNFHWTKKPWKLLTDLTVRICILKTWYYRSLAVP